MARETMLSQPIRAVLFDLDGTLIDTLPDLHAAACAMLNDLGRPPLPLESIRAEAVASYRRHYAHENGRNAEVYPGVLEGLASLRAQGVPLGVVTNKADTFIQPLLEQTRLSGYFEVLVGGDRLPKDTPDPMPLVWACGRLGVSPAETLFIGDSINDALAARAAGCPVFLLPYGYNEDRDVHELDCDAIVESVRDAVKLIRTPETV